MPELARELEHPSTGLRAALAEVTGGTPSTQEWTLALDELENSGVDLHPRLPLRGERELTGALRALDRTARPLSEIVEPLEHDHLTVVDDKTYLDRINSQPNLPGYVKAGLKSMY